MCSTGPRIVRILQSIDPRRLLYVLLSKVLASRIVSSFFPNRPVLLSKYSRAIKNKKARSDSSKSFILPFDEMECECQAQDEAILAKSLANMLEAHSRNMWVSSHKAVDVGIKVLQYKLKGAPLDQRFCIPVSRDYRKQNVPAQLALLSTGYKRRSSSFKDEKICCQGNEYENGDNDQLLQVSYTNRLQTRTNLIHQHQCMHLTQGPCLIAHRS